jgi:hypothetical protein
VNSNLLIYRLFLSGSRPGRLTYLYKAAGAAKTEGGFIMRQKMFTKALLAITAAAMVMSAQVVMADEETTR